MSNCYIVLKEPLKNTAFVIPAEAGIQDSRQKINFKVEIYWFFRASLNKLIYQNKEKHMDIIKVFFVSILWIIFVYFFRKHIDTINYLLGLVSLLSILTIIFGSVGYVWNLHKTNKEKQQKFKEMVFCGIIVLITTIISYSMTIIL
ncbi:hypothetical protein KAI56_03865 [Candidatus Parcubacteria bacterium]|nr:hypothetical protein [Candidatus Parcubacteria bacterium]